jgi:RNA recognition motif-containing protein
MDMGNRLYVGNLPFDATEKQIRSFVEGEGRKVTAVKIVTDRDTGRSRGFAFVDLESAEQAQQAISELNGKDFGGRALVVNEAQDKGPKSGSGFRSAFADKSHVRDHVKGGFGSRGPMQQMPRGSQRGGGRGGTRGS